MAEKSTGKPASEKKPRDDEDEDEREDESEEEESEEDESEASDDDDAPKGERDASTRGVAKALGVDADETSSEDDEAGEDDNKAEAKPNRAQRRRDEAQKRRAAREGKPTKPAARTAAAAETTATQTDEEDEAVPAKALPRDKNARAKELLRRRQESAMGKRVSKLEAAEVVQDRIARATSAVGGFIRDNFKAIAAVLVLGLGAAIGVSVYFSARASAIAKRSDELNKGVLALRGHVSPKPDPNYDAKSDPYPLYTTLEERADAAIAGFAKVAASSKGTAAATLARLGEGTALLDKREWDSAASAFSDVLAAPLANADADVKGRALEGTGYAKEGLEKWDEAMDAYTKLEAVKGMEDLGKYHRARMLLKQSKPDEAKTLLVELQSKLEVPAVDAPPNRLLRDGVDSALRQIDPTLVKKKAPTLGGMRGNSMTEAQMKALQDAELRKYLERLKKQEEEHGEHGPGGPGGPP